jgi:hypothetical protein
MRVFIHLHESFIQMKVAFECKCECHHLCLFTCECQCKVFWKSAPMHMCNNFFPEDEWKTGNMAGMVSAAAMWQKHIKTPAQLHLPFFTASAWRSSRGSANDSDPAALFYVCMHVSMHVTLNAQHVSAYAFAHVNAYYLGTRLGWYMTKPDRALKRSCSSAGSIITTVKTQLMPNHSSCALAHKSQEQHKCKDKHKHRLSGYPAVPPPLEMLSHQKKAAEC